MRIGIEASILSRRGLSPTAVLELAHEKRLSGVEFDDATQIHPVLDPDALVAFRRHAEMLGLELGIGLPPLSRWPLGTDGLDLGDVARRLYRHLEAAIHLGCPFVRAYVGDFNARLRTELTWSAQRGEAIDLLRRLAPAIREMGLKVGLENHADQTSIELVRMVEAVGIDIAGVVLDTGNLPLTLEDPLRASRRLAPHVLGVLVKDAVLAFSAHGLIWQDRPIGSGVLPILEILRVIASGRPQMNFFVKLQQRTLELPIFDRSWLGSFPDLKPTDLATVIELTTRGERRFRDGSLPTPEALDAMSWTDRDLDGLAQSVGFLRSIAELIERF